MITFVSCDARLDINDYHECCVLSPRHGGSHYDGLYYWETGKPSERQVAGERAARVLGLGWPRRRLGRGRGFLESSDGAEGYLSSSVSKT